MYKNKFNEQELEIAVMEVKKIFTDIFAKKLNLLKVSSPLFLNKEDGLNDYLNNDDQPITFKYQEHKFEIVQSLAKWKREEVKRLNLNEGFGIWTNMKAIRANEANLSPYHSLYVEQFDWELIITHEKRNIEYLKIIVNNIYDAIKKTTSILQKKYSSLKYQLPKKLAFITTEGLYKMYPHLSAKERENEFAKKTKAFFLLGIGHKLSHNKPHDDRAADYDDWNLNGDLILYNPIHDNAMEISSMGIRVDAKSLIEQMQILNCNDYFEYHKNIQNNNLPLTIGGGIGQSRLVLFILEQYHIGEFQCAYWSEEEKSKMLKLGVKLK